MASRRGPFEWIGDEIIDPLAGALGLNDGGAGNRERARAAEIWEQVGNYIPDPTGSRSFYDVIESGPSQWEGYQADPRTLQAQTLALRQMQQVAGAGGYTPVEREQIAQAQRQAALAEQSQRGAIQQQMAMRGVGGSGLDYAAQLGAQQSAANQGRADAASIAAQAQQRALLAMQAASQQAAQVRGQTLNEQGARNDAIDRFNQANTQHRRDVQARNEDERVAANQRRFDNYSTQAAGATGQYNANASASEARRAQTQNMLGGIIQSYIGSGGD